ncbi:MAG: polysialic acid transporter [Flavobacteriaceae bacterium]|nr:polysialic acid transporter [Flavobacteriaceae bacterium]|tara:strand:+ start:517 stop:1365 length:849 start_codon:yes stop_codon:yes gene_type:complete
MELPTRIYQKEQTLSFFKILKESLRDIRSSLFLARQLATRDITAQYRQSFLGILWAFITPLVTALVWIILNGSGAVRITDTGLPYPIFVISGTLLWAIITEAINSPISSTNGAKGILSKINFPKEALVVSGVFKLLFNALPKVLIMIIFMVIYGVSFQLSMLLFPVILLGAIFFGTTIGFFLTPIGMLYKDISKMISMGLKFLMYATPVVFAIPAEEGILKTLMELNPISPILVTARDFLVGSNPEYLSYFGIVIAICVPLFFIGLVLYRISIPIIVERMSA